MTGHIDKHPAKPAQYCRLGRSGSLRVTPGHGLGPAQEATHPLPSPTPKLPGMLGHAGTLQGQAWGPDPGAGPCYASCAAAGSHP